MIPSRKTLVPAALGLAAGYLFSANAWADPLRVFFRGGPKSHGPNAHEHERFMKDWTKLLNERGAKAEGGMDWPTAEQFKNSDVVVAYAQEGGDATPEQQKLIEDFVKRGGGLVVIHTASVSMKSPEWWKGVIGGSWVPGKTKWKEGPMDLYYTENQYIGGGHPITHGAANFHLDDEIYYDMDISPDVRVLATSYTPNVPAGRRQASQGAAHIYDIQPQMWVYEKTADGGSQPYRAFVSLPGHLYGTFEMPHYRAILLRGMAWAAKRPNLDEYVKPEEISSLTYPEGGPQKPEKTLANLEVHPDFDMTLVAAEPLITKPMNFDWAPDGSLWVAETPEYPNGRRGMRPDYRGKEWKDHGGIDPTPGNQDRPAKDKISRLIDTNGDGVADKKEVFYEGLDLVTGLVFHQDGVIVTQAPDVLFLRDTDHDGKADKVETLYTGLGTGDTHAVINNPRWGWDGWIYCTHGYSATNSVKNAAGKDFGGVGSGVVRFKPDGSAFEQYSSKGGNTWGLQITGDNRVMWTQPTSGQLLMHTVLPEYALARGKVGNMASYKVVEPSPKSFPLMSWEQLAYVQIDWVGSFTAAAGTVVYDGGSWPAEYNGDYFTTEPTINVIHHTRLTPEGASFKAAKLPGREETEFVRSRDMWWRPIEVRVAPDGSMYVGDFYNQAVIHNDTRGPDHNRVNAAVRPDRDHYFGRIWRIDHKSAKKIAVPDLSKASTADLAKALEHPNRAVRMTASRLLVEKAAANAAEVASAVAAVAKSASADARIAALWTLHGAGSLDATTLTAAIADADANVRRNAALVAEEKHNGTSVAALVNDADPQVRVAALRALATSDMDDAAAKSLVAAWAKFDDDFQRSAAVGAASQNPAAVISAALDSGDAALTPLVGQLAQGIAEKNNTDAAAKLVVALAAKPASADALKRSILDTLGQSLKGAPAFTPELTAAFGKLLTGETAASAFPLAARWDAGDALKTEIGAIVSKMLATLADANASADARLAAAAGLLAAGEKKAPGIASVVKVLTTPGTDAGLARGLIAALGKTNDPAVGAAISANFGTLSPEAQTAAFEAMLKRADWALAFLDAVEAKKVDPAVLGPANTHRLRTHPDGSVAKRANTMLEALNPMAKAKNEAIAKLLPLVEKPGNAANGKALFTATCATCHKFGDIGTDIGPNLTGMGSHGPGELLTAIVDPNREVDPSFTAWNIETKDGQFFAGIVARENREAVVIKSLAGQQEVKTAAIKSRVNTGKSLMPEGFDGLGGDMLRDIIAYMVSVDGGKFRTLDLREAFTASSLRGLYGTNEPTPESVVFAKTGTVSYGGVPFNVVAPEKSANGMNVLQLKGGPRGTFSKTLPATAEIKAGGFKANRLHILGGVGGWAFPFSQDETVALKATVHYAGGEKETLEFKNGVEFADYIARNEVPGSKFANGLTTRTQIRWFSRQLKTAAPVEKIVLESTDTIVAPTTFAITLELADANAKPLETAANPAPPAPWGDGLKVLLVGGGSSHDFQKWFNECDSATLKAAGGIATRYTEQPNEAAQWLGEADVLVFSTNKPNFSGLSFRSALQKFADAGKGIILLHPGAWYNMGDWAEFNKVFVGGGSRGHDRIGEFEVKAVEAGHPVLAGVPATVKFTDELYYMTFDPAGSPSTALSTATSPLSGKTFPSIWTVKNDKAKIVGIAPGHDGRTHEDENFKKILVNAVRWVAKK